MFQTKPLLASMMIAGSLLLASPSFAAVDLSKPVAEYKTYVEHQIDQLLVDTEKFVTYLKEGKLKEAKAIYPKCRMYYERSEPIAESFGDLDPRIDQREADLEKGEVWQGFHKIEKILWTENTTKGTEKIGEQLLADIKELRAKIPTVDISGEDMVAGAVDLLNEVTTSKITGEEEIFSGTDLYDFRANVEGADKIFQLLKPYIQKQDPKLVKDLQMRFATVYKLLDTHKVGKDDYKPYKSLTEKEIRALSDAVNQLGEPLAAMGKILD